MEFWRRGYKGADGMKAFLVTFPKKEPHHGVLYQANFPTVYPDNRPTLIVSDSISDVAALNTTATRIEEMDVSNVLVHCRVINKDCPFIGGIK
jgi:hypothetical protein